MRNGAYVTFLYDGETYKGRISIENGLYHLCQNVFNGTNCSNQYGHEYAWNMGTVTQFQANAPYYKVIQISKAAWEKFKEPIYARVFGHDINIDGQHVAFGCGAVTLTKAQIKEFIENYDKYKKIIKKRDELQAQINEETKTINKWLSGHPGTRDVIESVRGKGYRIENVNIEKLKRLFIGKERVK